jgi:signal transduction histidine kinase/CheY-like chemotaxis protein
MSVGELQVPENELPPETRFERYVGNGEETGVFAFRRKEQLRFAEYSAFAMGDDQFVSMLRDVTERRALEERFRQSQKMEAVGKLAGGIAHDFNNLLTGIISFVTFARDELEPGDIRREDLDEALNAADRASSLTRQLLAFSRKQPIQPRHLDLNELIEDSIQLLHRTLGEHIQIKTSLRSDLPLIHVDPGQFAQVLLNLAVNARDAMVDGGTLEIETSVKEHSNLGRVARVTVTDTGDGIPKDKIARIFEPFYTTKAEGKGTGLGLSLVYGAVMQAGGLINVFSESGKGTRFDIDIPVAHGEMNSEVMIAKTNPDDYGGDETILIVEDEPLVRRAVKRILARRGYSILEAPNGAVAIERFGARTESINLVISDVIMPELTGPETVREFQKTHPEIEVLFMTGYTDDALDPNSVGENIEVIDKPFEEAKLLATVRRLLDHGAEKQPR